MTLFTGDSNIRKMSRFENYLECPRSVSDPQKKFRRKRITRARFIYLFFSRGIHGIYAKLIRSHRRIYAEINAWLGDTAVTFYCVAQIRGTARFRALYGGNQLEIEFVGGSRENLKRTTTI